VRPKSQFSEDRVVLVQVLMGRPRIGLVRSVLYLYNPYNEESVSRKVSLADVRKEGEKENRKLARKLVLQGVVRLDLVINYGCNMNCYGCNHLAPLYDEDEVVPLDTIKDQVKKLAMLEGESFVIWAITGGEPLLHPNIGDVLRVVRFYFSGEILLWTNGLLLNKMSIDFWSALEECDVTLVVSVYGEGVDRSVFSEHKSIRVFFINKERFHVVGLSGVCEKGMKSTCNCNCNCLTVMKGKIYKCPVAGNLERFNKYFGENIPVSEKDFIDLNAIVNWKQLQVFHGKPSPLCSVCDRGVGVSWGLSKKEKSEWMVEESKE
jgi:ABC-2 type transport system ATP-binding protein